MSSNTLNEFFKMKIKYTLVNKRPDILLGRFVSLEMFI